MKWVVKYLNLKPDKHDFCLYVLPCVDLMIESSNSLSIESAQARMIMLR
jgi:hypothetical protein